MSIFDTLGQGNEVVLVGILSRGVEWGGGSMRPPSVDSKRVQEFPGGSEG